jgi:uncharacterized small protein (DUF1192 family)
MPPDPMRLSGIGLRRQLVNSSLRQVPTEPVDSKALAATKCAAMELDERPRPKGDLASQLALESLDSFSHHELDQRIALLEAEIARVTAHRDKAAAHRRAAEALFGTPSSQGSGS